VGQRPRRGGDLCAGDVLVRDSELRLNNAVMPAKAGIQ
jgi:hypothetical protein